MSDANNSQKFLPVAFMSASLQYLEHIAKLSIFEKNNIHCYFQAKLLNEFD